MKCPKCGKDVILQKKQVGVDENGNPVLNEYAICKDCKKQWNLDKQRAKKSAPKPAASVAKHTEAAPKQEAPKAPVEKTEETKATETKENTLSTQTSQNSLYRKEASSFRRPVLSIPKDRKRNVRSLIILKKRLGKNVLLPKLLMLYLRKKRPGSCRFKNKSDFCSGRIQTGTFRRRAALR